ncbi:hypothetical protein [Streptomyces rubrogriseus]|uniref:hypothetical protein n=1 Tax=Streptomyces rubrogriseus TaxID=194673 RepID=UPI00368748A1
MTTQHAGPGRSGRQTASVTSGSPFKPSLVKAVFGAVTPMHVSRSAAWAAGSVTRTVLTEIVQGARTGAAAVGRKKLIPGDLLSATDRNVELEVGPVQPHGDGRTVGRDDILAATTMQLFGGGLRQRALAEAREAARGPSAG